MRTLTRILDMLFRAAALVAALALMAIAIMITSDVLLRWLTGHPLTGVFEFSTVLLVLVTFLPLALVQFRNQQLHVDILTEHIKGRPGAALTLLDALAGLCVFGLLLHTSFNEFLKAYLGGFLLRGMIEIPTAIPLGTIVVGTVLMLLALVHRALHSGMDAVGLDSPESAGDQDESGKT
jgi:TRAP-type C4-dicarboxylate transport system permease small subunit